MRSFFLFLLMFLAVFAASHAQEPQRQEKPYMLSPRWLLEQEAQERPVLRSSWDGKGSWLAMRLLMLADREGETEIGLDETQRQNLSHLTKDNEIVSERTRKKMHSNEPPFQAASEEWERNVPKGDRRFEKATEEQKKAFVKSGEAFFAIVADEQQNEVAETLTDEQMQKLRLVESQLLPEIGLISPYMFDFLGLSDDQKEQMQEIKKAFESEFDKLIDEAIALRTECRKASIELAKLEYKEGEDFWKLYAKSAKEVNKNEELKDKYASNNKRGYEFSVRLKAKLIGVLTEEQLTKYETLTANPSSAVKKWLEGFREMRKQREKAGQWQPGPDSWKPGDGVSEEKRIKRGDGAFPNEE